MASLKEWKRDFKKLKKWEKFAIVSGIFFGIIGLFTVSNEGFNLLSNIYIDNPSIMVANSSYLAINYKSPNSPITITETKLVTGDCGSKVYSREISLNFTNFFAKPFTCGEGSTIQIDNLRYDIFNVKFILPTNQYLFVPEIQSGKSYILAYMNKDYSDACVVHKYRIKPEFSEDDVCFYFYPGEQMCDDPLLLKVGPAFFRNKSSCYLKISGETDFLGLWNPRDS